MTADTWISFGASIYNTKIENILTENLKAD